MGVGSDFLAILQSEAKASGFHKQLGWVDDKSSVAKALLEMDERVQPKT